LTTDHPDLEPSPVGSGPVLTDAALGALAGVLLAMVILTLSRIPDLSPWCLALAPAGLAAFGAWAGWRHDRRRARLHTMVAQARADLDLSRTRERRSRLHARATREAVVVHHRGIVTDVNEAFTTMFGYTPSEIVDRPVVSLIEPDARALLNDKLRSGSTGTLQQLTAFARDGRSFPIEATTRRLDDLPGTGVLVIRDVSEHRLVEDALQETERQLRHAQKMEAVGQLAAGIAHDFNNILTVIHGYCELLLFEIPETDPSRHGVEEIRSAGQSAATLTRQLLAFSRKQVQQLEVLQLREVVTDLGSMLRRLIGESIELVIRPEAGLHPVRADRGQMEQVITNLVVNARDAMPNGGRLTLELANATIDDAFVREHSGARPGSYVRLAIRDTGVGMDEAVQHSVFDPFFTTKDPGKGTGLGLSTVFGIVKQSGGYITLDSAPGEGACFTIYLPETDQPVIARDTGKRKGGHTRGAETILLVEDARAVRQVAARLLRRQGYTVLDTGEPVRAMEIAARHEGEIDLLLTDVVMPRITGPELAARVAESRPRTRVLYMSGYVGDATIESVCYEPGVPLLEKPFTPDALLSHVRKALEGPPAPLPAA